MNRCQLKFSRQLQRATSVASGHCKRTKTCFLSVFFFLFCFAWFDYVLTEEDGLQDSAVTFSNTPDYLLNKNASMKC